MRKAVLYIAISLDGYIADNNGGTSWLGGQDSNDPGDHGYSEFIAGIDTVIMGYTTYHQVVTELSPSEWPYNGLTSYVLTHRQIKNTKEIKFVNDTAPELVSKLKQQEGKSIWICGGANVAGQLIECNMIDEYHLATMPILLGKGIRLFSEFENRLPLTLVSSSAENGVLNCVYQRREHI